MEQRAAMLLYTASQEWAYQLWQGLRGEGACPAEEQELIQQMQEAGIHWVLQPEQLVQYLSQYIYRLVILILGERERISVNEWEKMRRLRELPGSRTAHIWILAASSPEVHMARREAWMQRLWTWGEMTPQGMGTVIKTLSREKKQTLMFPDDRERMQAFEANRIVSIEVGRAGRHVLYYVTESQVQPIRLKYEISLMQWAAEEIQRAGAVQFLRVSRNVIVNAWHISRLEQNPNKTGTIWVTGSKPGELRQIHVSRRMWDDVIELVGK